MKIYAAFQTEYRLKSGSWCVDRQFDNSDAALTRAQELAQQHDESLVRMVGNDPVVASFRRGHKHETSQVVRLS